MRKKYIKWSLFLIAIILLAIAATLASLSIGEMKISLLDIPSILKSKEGIAYTVIHKIRLPRIVLGFSVGGALSLAGAILQGIYRNPLVEPFTLGISGGAALGVALTIVFGLHGLFGAFMLPLSGFAGAMVTVFLVYSLSFRRGSSNIGNMLLIGVMISFVASSAMMFLMAITTASNLHSIIFWIMGSLDEPNTHFIKITFWAAIVSLGISYLFVTPLNALRLGEVKARHLGVNTATTIRILFVVSSLLTGICVAVAGVIGFVGLVIPHIVRIIIGSDFRILLISSFFGGGLFLIICDTIARTIISPNELPIGVITGIVGGLVFIIVLSKSKLGMNKLL